MTTETYSHAVGEIQSAMLQLPSNLIFALYLDDLVDFGPNLPMAIELLNPKYPTQRGETKVPSQSDIEHVSAFMDRLRTSEIPFAFLFRWSTESHKSLVFSKMSMSEAAAKLSDGLLYEVRAIPQSPR